MLEFVSSFRCFRSGFLICTGFPSVDVVFSLFSDGGMFSVEGSRYVGLVLFEEGLDLFFP